jgi:voltage-gated potassium channel
MAVPIFVSAVAPILMTMAGSDSIVANTVLVATWLVFVADYVVHWRLLPGYARTRRGWLDLGVVVLTAPWFLVPGLGSARFVTLARLARLARVVKASGGALLRLGRQLGRVGLATGLLVLTSAYVAYGAERSVNGSFSSFGEALWWATVTITTVGYGDIVPVTGVGRITGAVLMFAGLAVLGVLAGALASFFGFGERPADEPPAPEDAHPSPEPPPASVDELRASLAELERAIAAVRERLG